MHYQWQANDTESKALMFINQISDGSNETQQRGYKATLGLNEYKTKLASL